MKFVPNLGEEPKTKPKFSIFHFPFSISQRGSALIIALGIVSVVSLAAVLFTLAMRVNRAAAQNTRERAQARQDVYMGLAYFMNRVLPGDMLAHTDENGGEVYRTYFYATPDEMENAENEGFASGHVYGTFTNSEPDCLFLYTDEIQNLVPPRLVDEIFDDEDFNLDPRGVMATWFWSPTITYERPPNVSPDQEEMFDKFEFTGMTGMRFAALAVNCSGLLPAAAQPAIETNHEIRVYSDILNGDYGDGVVDATFHALYDPNPWQFCLYPEWSGIPVLNDTVNAANAEWIALTQTAATTSSNVVNAVNLAALTNTADAVAAFVAGLAYAQRGGPAVYDAPAAARLAVNYLQFASTNRAPFALLENPIPWDAGKPASRLDYGFTSLPMISQVILEPVIDEGVTGYRPGVVYYPFTPLPSPPEIDLFLTVTTNNAGISTADPRDFSLENTEIHAIPSLSTERPFHLVLSEKIIYFEERLGANDNAIYIWPRLVYTPANDPVNHVYDETLLNANQNGVRKWTEPGSIVYDDPRFNLYAEGQYAQLPDDRVPLKYKGKLSPNYPVDFILETDPRTNETHLADFNERLGTPWYYPNRPLLHAAELAYLLDDPAVSSNIILGIDLPHTAALVDCMAVVPDPPPASSNAYLRVNPNTPFTDVLEPLLGFYPTDPVFLADRLDNMNNLPGFISLDTITNAWRFAREKTNGRGWNNNAQFLPALAAEFEIETKSNRRLLNDLLVHVAPQVSFRQNAYVVIIQAQRLSPKGRPLATQRAAFTILRDAFTGHWLVYQTTWLTEK